MKSLTLIVLGVIVVMAAIIANIPLSEGLRKVGVPIT